MKYSRLFWLILSFVSAGLYAQTDVLSLNGEWTYKLDPDDKGMDEKWYDDAFTQTLVLPGSLNTNGIGEPVSVNTQWTGSQWNKAWYESDFYEKYRSPEDTKIVFWLTPDAYYVGRAWYQKKIVVPGKWKKKHVELSLERCHWQTDLWIDGVKIGTRNSLSVPHRYELEELTPGEHILTLCVDNRIKDIQPGVDAHSISDNTQSNWNGVIGKIGLSVRPKAYVDGVRIEPLPEQRRIKAEISLNVKGKTGLSATLTLQVKALSGEGKPLKMLKKGIRLNAGTNRLDIEYDMDENFSLWDEFNPAIYELNVSLDTKYGCDELKETFGLRKLGTEGTRITVNGRPVFFRGTLECCIFPETGFPSTDEAEWNRIMEVCKAHGLNHIRFHSWCPPEAAFNVADRLGMYLYVECGSWADDIGSGKPIDDFIMEESERIVKEYGNHPSFCLFSYGNEPRGKKHVEYLRNFVKHWKAKDNRFLYTTASGWPAVDESDWHCLPAPRIQGWNQGLKSVINSKSPNSRYDWSHKISKKQPTISHEIGQWCVYPDLKERARYTGVLKAKNFDIFEDRLRDNGLLHLVDSFLLASGKLQTLCYKADIEAALRTKGFAGFQLLDLHDFPGQGSALVGVLNPFWESKGYVTPQEYSEFCNQVVPLARLSRFVYNAGDTLVADVEVAQFSASDLLLPVIWQILDDKGKQMKSGSFAPTEMRTGRLNSIGQIREILNVTEPSQLQLVLSVGKYKNRWNLWVYPSVEIDKQDVLVATSFSEEVMERLSQGGKVLLSPRLGSMKNEGADSVAVGFSSIFWNTLWTNGQPPHTLGVLCNKEHAALRLFPTDYHSDYQWWDAMAHCNAIPLRKLSDAKPIVRIIDDWFTARSLGLIVEMKVGNGLMILCGADLMSDVEKRPEARQLLNSLLHYMTGDSFNPVQQVTIGQLADLFK